MKSLVKKLLFTVMFFTFTIFSFYGQDAASVTTITIKNARQTTYTKDKDTGNDLINLEGSVVISVQKGSNVSEIKADKVTYDRKSEMLYAEGSVEITTKSGSAGAETTNATALLMNAATLEGVFDDGRVVQTQSDAINLPSGSTLVVFSDIFGKSESNVIAFKNSSLTFCDEEDPHWRIDASRTWLLPGGEFAFFNALLYVGELPIMYFPAFYYPKDELIFNPVFAYATRTGYSVQTSTYVYGRKPLSSGSSSSSSSDSTAEESLQALYNFMRPGTLKEQKREGLILHNLDDNYSGDTTNYIKILGDWYSNLGIMGGVDGKLSPAPKYISTLTFNAYAGFSNTIFKDSSGNYVPYSSTGESYYDSSSFLGLSLPFRYSGNLQFGLSKPFKITLSLPIYSDPYFSNDFLNNRQETMDWISYFMSSSDSGDDSSTSISEVSSFSWTLSTSYSFVIPSILKKVISSASFSTNSSIAFSSMKTSSYDSEKYSEYETEWQSYTPVRKFYYPSQIVPATVNLSISGTIFKYPYSSSSDSSKKVSYKVALNQPDELKSDSQIKKEKEEAEKAAEEAKKKAEEEAKKKAEEEAAAEADGTTEGSADDLEAGETEENPVLVENSREEGASEIENTESTEIAEESTDDEKSEEEEKSDALEPVFPELTHSSSLATLTQGLNYSLSYSVTPSLTTQIAYSSSNLKTSEDFEWKNPRSFMYTAKIPASLSSNLTYGSSFFTMNNKFSFDPVFQDHPYINISENYATDGFYSEDQAKSLKLADNKAQSRNILNTNSISFYPFVNYSHFSGTGLTWNSTVKLYRREFIGDADNEEWEAHTVDFTDKDCVTVNSASLYLSSNELSDKLKQTITLTTVLPPQLKQYTAAVSLVFPYVTATFGAGITEQETTDTEVSEEDKWKKNPLQQALSISLFNSKLKITESSNYDIEDDEPHWESLKTSLSFYNFSLAYVMSYTTVYELDEDSGYISTGEKKFQKNSLSLSYSPTSKTYYKWFNRVTFTPGLSTSLVADLLRPAYSYLTFSPNISFKINEFFTLSLSSTSKNSILYWYFNEGMYDDGLFGLDFFPFNCLLDLLKSFNFFKEDDRKNSGFKLKSLNLTMSHQLHDWSFNLTATVSPKIVTKKTGKEYDVTPTISIGIVWNPMSSIKSNLVYEYDDDEEKGVWSLEQ